MTLARLGPGAVGNCPPKRPGTAFSQSPAAFLFLVIDAMPNGAMHESWVHLSPRVRIKQYGNTFQSLREELKEGWNI